MKKRIALAIIILLGIVLFIKLRPQPSQIKTETVKRGTIVKSVSASGKVDSQERVDLKFQVSGLLTWVGVKEGDSVSAWQAIASLDTRELQKNLQKALRDYSSERNDFEEARQVTYDGQTIEVAASGTIKRILQKNQWDLEKAVLDVELKDLALKYATLITPIAGIVTSIDTPIAGVNITPATAIFTVANPEKMIFKANIDESDIGVIQTGLKTIITLDAYPDETFEGTVSKVSFASVTTSGGGTAFPVEIVLPQNSDLKFKVGLSGDIDITIFEKENVLLVPSRSITSSNSKNYVEKLVSGKKVKEEVKTGIANSTHTEIISGLKEGDKVVVK